MDKLNTVYVFEAKVGIIYSGSSGEIQKDKEDNFWHKSYYDNTITKINPHPSSHLTIVKEVEKG